MNKKIEEKVVDMVEYNLMEKYDKTESVKGLSNVSLEVLDKNELITLIEELDNVLNDSGYNYKDTKKTAKEQYRENMERLVYQLREYRL